MKAQKGTHPKDRRLLHTAIPMDTPLTVDLFISGVCNFKCNYCLQSAPRPVFIGSGLKPQFMDMETFELTLKQIRQFPRKIKSINFCGIGEPTLHESLPEMIRAIREADVAEEVMVITNGSRLTPQYGEKLVDAGLQILRISLQGLSAEKYWEISKARIDWDKFYENIVHFSKIKGDCKLKVKIADTAMSPRGGGRAKVLRALRGHM